MNLEEARIFRMKQGKLPDEIGVPISSGSLPCFILNILASSRFIP